MLKVGLTGGLASGKSFVGACLQELGAHVIQADRLGHHALEADGEAYAAVVEKFGETILLSDGQIDRKSLGALVFPDPKKLEELNAIIHPIVWRRQQEFFAHVEAKDPHAVAVVEAAILIETGAYKRYDRLVVAACSPEVQVERFMAREDATEEQARARMDRQMPLDEKLPFADYVIDTSGSKQDTRRRTSDVYAKLRAEAEA